MASTYLTNVKDSKYGNYMTEATHVMDAMRGFGLSMNKIGTSIQQNNVKQTIVKHMIPHVQKHLEGQNVAQPVSQETSETTGGQNTVQPQGETEVLEPQQ